MANGSLSKYIKIGLFWAKFGAKSEIPNLIYTFLLKTLRVLIESWPRMFILGNFHEYSYASNYKIKKRRTAIFIRHICGERKNILGHCCSKTINKRIFIKEKDCKQELSIDIPLNELFLLGKTLFRRITSSKSVQYLRGPIKVFCYWNSLADIFVTQKFIFYQNLELNKRKDI